MSEKQKRKGTKNLIPFNKRTEEEQKNITTKGGIASGIARKEKKQVKELLQTLFQTKAPDDLVIKVKKKFPDIKIKTLEELINLSMMIQAYSGNVGAYNALYDRMEGKPNQTIKQEMSAEVKVENVKSLLGESIQEEK